jgi:hypothetical protein
VEEGRLVECGWLVNHPSEAIARNVLPGYAFPPESALILGVESFQSNRADEDDGRLIRAMLQDAACDSRTRSILITCRAGDIPMQSAIEEAGFVYQGSLFARTRFGLRSNRWVSLQDCNHSIGWGVDDSIDQVYLPGTDPVSTKPRKRKLVHSQRA